MDVHDVFAEVLSASATPLHSETPIAQIHLVQDYLMDLVGFMEVLGTCVLIK